VIDEFLGLAYCREKGLPVVVVRLFNTVGPRQSGQYGMVVPRFVQQALSGESLTVYGDGKQSRCFTHVKDVLRALMLLVDVPGAEGQIFNVGSNEEITILDLAHRVVGLVEARDKRLGESPLNDSLPAGALVPIAGSGNGRIRMLSYEEAYHSTSFEDMRRRIPSIDKIHRYTLWTPTLSLDDVINDVLDEYAKRNLVFSAQKAWLATPPKYSAVESRNVVQAVSSQRGKRVTTVGRTIGGTIPVGRLHEGVDHRPGRYDDA
jgi:UDP-glucose 4-epimerase